jgi:hypothetical protein
MRALKHSLLYVRMGVHQRASSKERKHLCNVVARARFLVHEVSRAKEFAELRRAHSDDHTGLKFKEHRTGHVLAYLGLVVKHVDAVELCIVAAAVLAVAADAALVAHHISKLCAHLVTALARLNVHDLARRRFLKAGSAR